MNRLSHASILAITLTCSGNAGAALIDRGGGMIYDSWQNLTWLQDANHAKTSGYDSDGLMTWDDAETWASTLVYGGFDDWRLPLWRAPRTVAFDGFTVVYAMDEITTALTQVPLDCSIGADNSVWCLPSQVFLDLSPIVIWPLTVYLPPIWYGTDSGSSAWALDRQFFPPGGNLHAKSDLLQAWAVRDGDIAAIPEPGSLALVALGLAYLGSGRSRKSVK